MIRLELPFPPSVNAWTRSIVRKGAKHASVIKTAKQREYLNGVASAMRTNTKHFGAANIAYHLTLHFPDKRRRDGSNYIKAIEDALNGKLWNDDSQVKAFSVRCVDAVKTNPGKAVLWVCALSEYKDLISHREGVDVP